MPHSVQHDGYLITDERTRLDVAAVHAFLSVSYWAANIPRDVVARALENSLCLGIYAPDGTQIGLVRAVTDYATFAYICDVYVLEPHRRRGLSKAAMKHLLAHPQLQGLRRLQLVTHDAQGLYAQFGFQAVAEPHRHMERRRANPYPPSSGAPAV